MYGKYSNSLLSDVVRLEPYCMPLQFTVYTEVATLYCNDIIFPNSS